MKTHTIKRTTFLAASVASFVLSQPFASAFTFTDPFEAPTLDPFWSVFQLNGTVTLSPTLPHAGSQSVQFQTFNNGLNKEVQLFHNFGQPVYGQVSIYLYDAGADLLSGNYLEFYTTGGSGNDFKLFTQDYDLGPSNGGNYYYYSALTGGVITGIDRSQAWHKFSIDVEPAATTLAIDNQLVFTGPGGTFNGLTINMHAPDFRPGQTAFVDDAFVNVVPEPSAAVLAGLAGTMMLGLGRSRVRQSPAAAIGFGK